MTRISNSQRAQLYGEPGEADRVVVTTPWGIRTQTHRLVRDVFLEACEEAAATVSWVPKRIDGYNFRRIAGSPHYSLHSWALAWDFFATPPNQPPPGGVWTPDNGMTPEFAWCFTRRGFTWGGTWQRQDVPHLEWASAPPSQEDEMTPAQELKLDAALQMLTRLEERVAATERHAQHASQTVGGELRRGLRAVGLKLGLKVEGGEVQPDA